MIIAMHQPDLLPYSGFWYKMVKSDVFVIRVYDQLVESGYQRRVKMRDKWLTLPAINRAPIIPILETKIDRAATQMLMKRQLVGRYCHAPFWKQRKDEILDIVCDVETDYLWQYNLQLIMSIRDYLDIRTPLSISPPPVGMKNDSVIELLLQYPDPTYLSGTGARVYMGDCQEYTDAGIPVVFSQHVPVTGDSIISLIFDHEDPMVHILNDENEEVAM